MPHRGIKPASGACRSDALATELHPRPAILPSGINTEIKVNGQKLETVTSFKYLGSIITDEGSKPELLCRIAQATAAAAAVVVVVIFVTIISYCHYCHQHRHDGDVA